MRLPTYTLIHKQTQRKLIVNQGDYHNNLAAYDGYQRVSETRGEGNETINVQTAPENGEGDNETPGAGTTGDQNPTPDDPKAAEREELSKNTKRDLEALIKTEFGEDVDLRTFNTKDKLIDHLFELRDQKDAVAKETA